MNELHKYALSFLLSNLDEDVFEDIKDFIPSLESIEELETMISNEIDVNYHKSNW